MIDFEKLFNTLDLKNNHFIIGGDFNCRHPLRNDTCSNQFGSKFVNWYLNNQVEHNISILKSIIPTYKNISFLDFFLVNTKLFNFQNNSSTSKTYSSFSDQNAIQTNFDFNNSTYKILLEEPQTFFNFSATSWNHLKIIYIAINSTNLNIPNNRNISNTEIDSSLDSINSIIEAAMSSSIPKIKINNWGNLNLPYSILTIIKEKTTLQKKLYRYAVTNFHIVNYTQLQLKSQIKCLSTLIKQNINNHFNNKLKYELQNIRVNNNPYVELNKFLKTGSNSIPHITDRNNITTIDTTALNTLAEHFEKTHSQNMQLGDLDFSFDINNWAENFKNTPKDKIINFTNVILADSESPTDNNFISLTTLINIIKKSKNKKSCGPDGIPNIVLKHLPKFFVNKILILFNQITNTSYFLKKWKIGKIFPILKPSKPPNLISSYGPISLLSCLSKIYENILYSV